MYKIYFMGQMRHNLIVGHSFAEMTLFNRIIIKIFVSKTSDFLKTLYAP